MALDPELARLVAKLDSHEPVDMSALAAAGAQLGFDWPADYLALMSQLGKCDGSIGEWYVQLSEPDDVVDFTRTMEEFLPGLVLFGSDGGNEILAYDRKTRAVVLVAGIGDFDRAILLGSNLTEAFARLERDDIFDDPVYPYAQPERNG